MRASRERSRGRRRRVAPRARSRAQTTHRRGPRGRGEGSAPRSTAGSRMRVGHVWLVGAGPGDPGLMTRSEEHTSELQSRLHLVCRLLLEKKKINMAIIFVGYALIVCDMWRGASLIQLRAAGTRD